MTHPCACTHTQKQTHTDNNTGENPNVIDGGNSYFCLFFFLFLLYLPATFFFYKRTSCKTEKICKPWSGKSEFSQWEHSMIPAGLSRRVNTFFFQARNTLAEEGKTERAPGKGGSKDGRRDREMKSTDKLSWLGVRSSFS
ncbi:hypothetical protein ATANTOWER_014816 [Ataeniobius toweri]|uniref:ATP synthase F0 subunit 8 n=1 Tax=Ataeniobius toweri TaxID=208326 RepID=A0ABU7AG14_9TELE|nr:hypothetical protein [Ataeniobius toweri]